MELEDLKQAWNELNKRVEQSELTNRAIITNMIMSRKEGSIQYLYRLQKMSLVFISCLTILITGVFWMKHLSMLLLIVSYIPLFTAIMFEVISLKRLMKIRKGCNNLEEQLCEVLTYKAIQGWESFVVSAVMIPFVVVVLYYNHNYYTVILMFVLIVIGVCMDYFIYHYISDKVKDFSSAVCELKELKQQE